MRPRFAGFWREELPGRIGPETERNSKEVWIKQSILCGAGIAISPGLTVTERLQQVLKIEAETGSLSEEAVLGRAHAEIPLRRCAAPDEIADLALFLASDKAGYLTGAIIPMDGGSNPVL